MIIMQPAASVVCEPSSRPQALRLHAEDNVAVVLEDVAGGAIEILGCNEGATTIVIEPIGRGHKIALRAIAEGAAVVKYGVRIGVATTPIDVGRWVHTHNCRSGLDERSHTLDPHSGAPTDTRYE